MIQEYSFKNILCNSDLVLLKEIVNNNVNICLKYVSITDQYRQYLMKIFQIEKIIFELNYRSGIVILKKINESSLSLYDSKHIFWLISNLIGIPLEQNISGDLVYSAKDLGHSQEALKLKPRIRGTKTRAALDLHTDSAPNFRGNTPDIIGLHCLNRAYEGGETVLMQAKDLVHLLKNEKPEFFTRLQKPFYFDKRSECTDGEPNTLFVPIISYKNGFSLRYSFVRIVDGYDIKGIPIDTVGFNALKYINQSFLNNRLIYKFYLEDGDMLYLNNSTVLHGRTAFIDSIHSSKKRTINRIWLKNHFTYNL